jgi:nitrite reductase/ring-hydroxylating ferredoxin subunit
MPFGWFQICWPEDLPAGHTLPLFYFDRHLVAWRDEDGGAHLMDAFCPHMGTHLGYGARVDGCNIVCPLHSWTYDADGHNIDIPYSDKVNRAATIRTYPVMERNGLVMAWYHPEGVEPQWDMPELEAFAGTDDFGAPIHKQYRVNTHWQEIAETTVDAAHVQAHLVRYERELFDGHAEPITAPDVEAYEIDGPVTRMRFAQRFPTPMGVMDGRIDTDAYGPGLAVTAFTGVIDTYLLGCAIPVDRETTEVRFTFAVRSLEDAAATASVGEAFAEEIHTQTVKDVPIWENKAYLPKPMLSKDDGPIMQFRRWAEQFYAEGVEQGPQVWAPRAPAEQPDPQPSLV